MPIVMVMRTGRTMATPLIKSLSKRIGLVSLILMLSCAALSTTAIAANVDVFGLSQAAPSSKASAPDTPSDQSASTSDHSSTASSSDAPVPPAFRIPEPLRVVLSAGIVWQGELNARIENAAARLRSGSSPAVWWTLVLMSFAYGILHAVGPGHGKLMVGAYLGSRHARIGQAVALSVWTATVQALSAIVLVFAALWISRDGLTHVLSQAASLEVVGYGVLCGAALWTLWTSVTRRDCCFDPSAIRFGPTSADSNRPADDSPSNGRYLGAKLTTINAKRSARRLPLLSTNTNAGSTLSQMIALGIAAGIRPCVGAIFVLVASVTAGIPGVGIASAFAMSAGVAITVMTIAIGGVGVNRILLARGLRYRSQVQQAQRICAIVGAVVILLYGATQITLLLNGYLTPSIT